MAKNSKIEWTDHTFNPWVGCQKVSPACDNCYAEEWAKRFGRDFNVPTRTSAANWKQPIKWNRSAEIEHNGWAWFKEGNTETTDESLIAAGFTKPVRPRVFCASLGDVFDNRVPDQWREDLFELIRITPHLDWLLLTKRPQNIVRMVQSHGSIAGNGTRYLPDNVRLGATCENQKQADMNITALLRTRYEIGARSLFLSIEPMLGVIDVRCYLPPMSGPGWVSGCRPVGYDGKTPLLHWVICGGESGHNARPMHPDWARSLRDQCAEAGVPFMFKQWGEWVGGSYIGNLQDQLVTGSRGEKCKTHDFGDGVFAARVGKKAAGRLLDGVLHDGYPEVRT